MIDTSQAHAVLTEKLAQVTEELAHIATHDEHTDDWVAIPVGTETAEADETDEADVVEEWNERRATVSVLETDYRNLKRALSKIAEGSYGVCEISGQPIEDKRLLANPAARTCIAHMDEEGTLPL
jgi:DnaK suppressor protein